MGKSIKWNLLLGFLYLLLNSVVPTLAFDPLNLDVEYYYIIGGGIGGVVLVIIICCCCCCRKRKAETQKRTVTFRGSTSADRIRQTTPLHDPEMQKMEERRIVAPVSQPTHHSPQQHTTPQPTHQPILHPNTAQPNFYPTQPLPEAPRLHTEEERGLTSVEHRRKLESIILSQASAANRGDDDFSNDFGSHGLRAKPGDQIHRHAPSTEWTEYSADQPTNLPERSVSLMSNQSRTHFPLDPHNIITNFERSKRPSEERTSQSSYDRHRRESSEEPEFVGIKLRPIPLNKSGGTYLPPEDF